MEKDINEPYNKWFMEISNQEYQGNMDWLGLPVEDDKLETKEKEPSWL